MRGFDLAELLGKVLALLPFDPADFGTDHFGERVNAPRDVLAHLSAADRGLLLRASISRASKPCRAPARRGGR